MFHLIAEQLFFLTRFRRFKKFLWKKMNEMRQTRQNFDCLYFIEHIVQFFNMIMIHTTILMNWSFNFILTSRKDNDVESNFIHHLFKFMRFDENYQIFRDTLMIFITSNVMLNAYSSKMHDKTILILTNTNAQHLIKIRKLRFENALWHLILTFLSSVFYWNIWRSRFHLEAEHSHL